MAENRIIDAIYVANGFFRTKAVSRYSYGQVLRFVGFTLPETFEVHFAACSDAESTTMIGSNDMVNIPDEYVENEGVIKAWLFLHDTATDGETVYTIDIPIKDRARPSNMEPTPVQQDAITQAIAALNAGVERAEELEREWTEIVEEVVPQMQEDIDSKADKRDTVLETTLSRGRKEGTTVGVGSLAFGLDAEASGNYSHAEGSNSVASGTTAHSEGFYTTASGYGAHSEGRETIASGSTSHAEGRGNIASGSGSHAEGNKTEAIGGSSHSEGFTTKATGIAGHSEGFCVIASGQYQHAQGKFNVEDTNNTYADIVGNGNPPDSRSNAYALTWAGDGKYAGDVYVHANPDSTGGDKLATEDYVTDVVSHISSMSIHICTAQEYDSQTGIPTIANPDATTFYLVPGGDAPNLYIEWVYVNGAWEKFGSATIDLSNYVQKTDYATQDTAGVVKISLNGSAGIRLNTGYLEIYPAGNNAVKTGTTEYKPIVPAKQHLSTFYGLAKAAGDTTQAASDNAVGAYTDEAKAAIKSMLDVTDPSVNDVQVNGTSVLQNGVANVPLAGESVPGVVVIGKGLAIADGAVRISAATDSEIKSGVGSYRPIVPGNQKNAAFYGLAKAAGDTTQSQSANAVGTYTSEAKAAIQTMLDVPAKADIPEVPVQDVQVNGVSVLQNGIANVPVASSSDFGVVKTYSERGTQMYNGAVIIYPASSTSVKSGTDSYKPVVPGRQHESAFFGLAKAAGDTTQSQSANPVGTYTDEAKAAIQIMLGVPSASDIPEYATDAETQSIITDWEASA